ncbi:MAG TPA: acetate--CoA ligase [Polyangiaceae bacterium LLY-WYZ-15_(1-7)]|nr:acetate--CoA ligase [Sandaracinus sp.]HJK90203.1 acetate--CoA ligase [Polyangiaceae bacterium LLY-WYZ-15_(1-7)]MBJ75150.1 acetate--CoA ligase [Sandaracinus sp.]HJL04643.1 acetate--CoA ligase [Polyangiaceae bacterium LLY-WYZ-15_(1-7)]HJL07425.1 acetate--CoA ligase [Polyangiaceae bacterium LLY-WYZ-15_(1-7)]
MRYDVPDRVRENAATPIRDLDRYRETHAAAANDPNGFWLGVTKERIAWREEPTLGLEGDFHGIAEGPLSWFGDGRLNVTESCLDRHLEARGDKVAILWEGDEPGEVRKLTYRELHAEVCKAANALAALGLKKGERAIIYMGMVPEAAIAMLACARLGAVHSVVFGGFSADALRDRVRDCGAEIVITQDLGVRGGKHIPLKATVDEALAGSPSVKKVLVYKRTEEEVPWDASRDVWWHEALGAAEPTHEAEIVEAEHPLFVLYTSGSTGRPKGVVHTSGGYITYTSYTHATVFDLREDDVYACVADVGWITGHSYIVYGPLANGATTLMFESIPTYPDAGRYWDMVQRHGVTIFYTAPTAIRALAAKGDEHVTKHDRSTLRVLGTVGEPINPEAWVWYFDVVGEKRCTIVDTWWQTETGGIAISPIAPATPTKPGSATLPMPGILTSLRTKEGAVIRGPGQGLLCIDHPWPGQARTVWGDHERFVATYFGHVPGAYFTGDGCRRDEDGYHWITGRVDDVLNVSGHRMGTAEFEAAIVSVEEVAEAAVVGYPHEVKGQGVYAYVVPQGGATVDPASLNGACRTQIGAHAKIDRVQVVPGLPKTRSGKVMRRILRKIAEGRGDELGDTSTLADPSVVDAIRDGFVTKD